MDTKITSVEILPLIKHYMDELGLASLFDKYIPNPGMELSPAQVLCMMIMNIMVSAKPLYRIEEWLHDHMDGMSEEAVVAAKYNDDRCARNLNLVFSADRNALLAELTANAIRIHQLEITTVHNDSTSITLIGAYDREEPDAAKPAYGYNKDHRPDCKQLVFGLNVTNDGHVPLSYEVYDGNRSDVTTHVPNWLGLRELLGREDFVYVADSKLCSFENLQKIDENGGLFITVIPRNFREVSQFLDRVREGEEIEWQATYETPDSRKKGQMQRYRLHTGEQMNEGGYRILWVHSESKERLERDARERRIAKAEKALENLSTRLNKRSLQSREAIEKAIEKAVQGSGRYLWTTLHEEKTIETVQIGRGRPGPHTRYEEKERLSYRLEWERDERAMAKAQRADGLFPLVDNTALEPAEVLRTYKEQPSLEKRFSTGKTVLEVAPVFLKDPKRIEAMLFLYFIALMLVSLIERRIRREMSDQEIESLPMRPAEMHTKKPTWRTIKDTFGGVYLAMVEHSGDILHCDLKGLTELRRLVLKLLKVPISVYTELAYGWWDFGVE